MRIGYYRGRADTDSAATVRAMFRTSMKPVVVGSSTPAAAESNPVVAVSAADAAKIAALLAQVNQTVPPPEAEVPPRMKNGDPIIGIPSGEYPATDEPTYVGPISSSSKMVDSIRATPRSMWPTVAIGIGVVAAASAIVYFVVWRD